jgi:hypothetical protein
MARREEQVSSRDKRLGELGALAKIFAEFQGPQLQQAELAQKGQQGDTNAMIQALGLMQQRKEVEQRAAQAEAANQVALQQLGLTGRQVSVEEQKLPVALRQGEEEILKSQATRTLAPRQAATEEDKVAVEREKLRQSGGTEGQKRLVDILEMLSDPSRAASQGLIGAGIQGQPGMEPISAALGAQEAQRQQTREAALAPAMRMMQGGQAPAPAGPPLPIQNLPGEVFGRSVVDLIPNLANTVNPLAEGALGMLGMKTNLGRVPSWWEAYKRMTTGQ